MFPDLISFVRTVQKQGRAFFGGIENLISIQEIELMNGDEVRALNQVGALDGLRAKAQVRNSHGARFL